MHMYYWCGIDLGTFLFQGYNVVTLWAFLATCLGLTALAILYEGMKILQMKLRENSQKLFLDRSRENNSSLIATDSDGLLDATENSSTCSTITYWMLEVFHWSLHVSLGYILMLAVMTYNIYITIAVVCGSGIGYYIFGPVLIEANLSKLQKYRKVSSCNPACTDVISNTERRDSTSSTLSGSRVVQQDGIVEVHSQEST